MSAGWKHCPTRVGASRPIFRVGRASSPTFRVGRASSPTFRVGRRFQPDRGSFEAQIYEKEVV